MAGIEPRKDNEYLRRKLRDLSNRVERLEASPRIDPGVGVGMGRPWLAFSAIFHYPPDDPNNFPGTTSSTFVILARAGGVIQHPHLLVWLNWFIPDAATSGEYRVGIKESVHDAPDPDPIYFNLGIFNGPNGGTGNPVVIPGSVDFGSLASVDIEARRTAGTGTVRANLGAVFGCGLRDNPYDVIG